VRSPLGPAHLLLLGVSCISPRKGIFQALLNPGGRCRGRPIEAPGRLGRWDLRAVSRGTDPPRAGWCRGVMRMSQGVSEALRTGH
jgi:hypothetical protein